MLLRDLNTENWTLSIGDNGGAVTDLEEINQCVHVILMTKPGSDPLRPQFGCGLFDFVDRPVNVAVPKMTREIAAALFQWEPRVVVKKISVKVDVSHITIEVDWTSSVGNKISRVEYNDTSSFQDTRTRNYNFEYSEDYN